MLRIDALKVLSSETRCTLLLPYKPPQEMRNAFMLPKEVTVTVEIFPIGELSVFARSEPLFYADGYLTAENGAPSITPCPSNSFCTPSLVPPKTADTDIFNAGVKTAAKNALDGLVKTAKRKSEEAVFNTKKTECMRLSIFLAKIGRVSAAFGVLHEGLTRSLSGQDALLYLIYDAYYSLMIEKEKKNALDKAVGLSSALDGSLPSLTEDRVIACILTAVKRCKEKTPNALSFYTRVKVSSSKKTMFFYLLSQEMGALHGGARSALLKLAEKASMCNSCTYKQVSSTNKMLRSMRAVSSSVQLSTIPSNTLINKYRYKDSVIEEITISISTDLNDQPIKIEDKRRDKGEDKRRDKGDISVMVHDKLFISSTHAAKVCSILIESLLPMHSFTLHGKQNQMEKKRTALILCSFFSEKGYIFSIPRSAKVKEIKLDYKTQILTYPCSISVEVVPERVNKRIYAHRYMVLPTILMKNRPVHETVSKFITKYAGAPCTLSSLNRSLPFPMSARIPFMHGQTLLHETVNLYWVMLPIAEIEKNNDYEDQASIRAIDHEILLGTKSGLSSKYPSLAPGQQISVPWMELKCLFWHLSSGSKRGPFFL